MNKVITSRDIEIEAQQVLYSISLPAGKAWEALKNCDPKTYTHLQELMMQGIDKTYTHLEKSDPGMYKKLSSYMFKWKDNGLQTIVTKFKQTDL